MPGVTEGLILVAIAITLFIAYYVFAGKKPTPAPKTSVSNDNKSNNDKTVSNANRPPMSIFYGSQSGTAETFANDLAQEAKTYGFDAKAVDLEGFDAESQLAEEKFGVFLMATFGEGEPTDNAAGFYEWLMSEDRDESMLTNTEFAVFGLGNRQYEHFCAVGRKVDKRLGEIGGQRLIKHGEGDDDGSLEDDYNGWKAKFWKKARAKFLNESGDDMKEGVTSQFETAYEITLFPPKSNKRGNDDEAKDDAVKPPAFKGGIESFLPDPKLKAELATVTVNRELRQDTSDGGSTRHLEFDISKLRLRYLTADNLGIYPRNDFKIVGKVAKHFGLHPDTIFTFAPKSGADAQKKLPFPSPCSVRDALLWYCDLTSQPRGKMLTVLAQYAKDPQEKQKLLNYTTTEKDAYAKDMLSMWEVFEEFPSVQPPFMDFLEFCPKLQARFYTISSSSKTNPTSVHVTSSLTVMAKPRARTHLGVCTSYLASLREGDPVCVFVRPSTFRLPVKPVPIVMVGPGTGVAPFRAFVQEARTVREKQEKKGSVEKVLGEMTLFFGCRKQTVDYIYREELQAAEKDGVLSSLVVAFSRDQPDQKVYVQNRMAEHGQQLWKALSTEGGHFYVCGGTSMGRAVKEELVAIARKHGELTSEKAQEFVQKLQTDNRYIQELWS